MDIQSWTPFYDQDQTNEDTFFHVPGISGLLSPERILTTNGDRAAEDSGPDHVCLEEVYFFLYRARTCSTPSQHPSSINPTIENQSRLAHFSLQGKVQLQTVFVFVFSVGEGGPCSLCSLFQS